MIEELRELAECICLTSLENDDNLFEALFDDIDMKDLLLDINEELNIAIPLSISHDEVDTLSKLEKICKEYLH